MDGYISKLRRFGAIVVLVLLATALAAYGERFASELIMQLPPVSGLDRPWQSIGGLDVAEEPSGGLHLIAAAQVCGYVDDSFKIYQDVVYACSSNGWAEEPIARTRDDRGYQEDFNVKIALDDDSVPHIAYSADLNTLVHALKTDGIWQSETLPDATFGYFSNIAFDADGTLHLMMMKLPTYSLYHVYKEWVVSGLRS